jgi:WD40 repeat protein
VLALAWSPDSKSLAAGLDGGGVRLWRFGGARPVPLTAPLPKNFMGPVFAVAWSADGKVLAGGANGAVLFWEAPFDKPSRLREEGNGPVRALAWSPGGAVLAGGAGLGPGWLRLWKSDNAFPRQFLRELRGNAGGVLACAWSPDGKVVASAGADRAVRFWEAATGQPLAVLEGHTAAVSSLSWRPKADTVAAAGRDGTIRLGGRDGKGYRILLVPLLRGQGVALSPEGHSLASPEVERSLVVVVQTDGGQEVYSLTAFRNQFGWKDQPDRVRLGAK